VASACARPTGTGRIGAGLAAAGLLAAACGLEACTADPPGGPGGATAEDRLRAAAEGPIDIERDERGNVRAVVGTVPLSVAASASPQEKARAFLDAHGDVFGLDPAGTREVDVVVGDPAMGETGAVVVLEQTVDGVPVYGSDVRVEVGDGAEALSATARTTDDTSVSTRPTVTPALALASALGFYAGFAASGEPSLVLLDVGMFTGEATPTRLAWKVPLTGRAAAPVVFIDAQTGRRLLVEERMISARRRETYDAMNGEDIATILRGARTLLYTEAGAQSGVTIPAEATQLHDLAGEFWNYMWRTFRRDGHDGRGGLMQHHARFGTTRNNAFYCADATWFMEGLVTDDVLGHEVTHGLVEKTARLPYVGWSGALNEHYADVFGVMFDREDWDVGEDCELGTIRSFSDPTAYHQPRHTDQEFRIAAGEAPSADNDYGGVHINSGIPNHAAYLMSEGGTHADSGIEVRAIGRDKTEQLHFRALTWYMGGASRVMDAKIAMRLAALRFAQRNLHGVTYNDCGAVLNAYAAVGVGAGDRDEDCYTDGLDNCPDVYNPDQRDSNKNGRGDACETDAGPQCRRRLQSCRADSDCCNSMSMGGTFICELGQCVDGAMCVRVGSACTVRDDCCQGVRCQRIGSDTGPMQCCGSDSDPCTSDDQCCGAMQCSGGRCQCRRVGEPCVTATDCCGGAFCNAGTCTSG
jgi:Zn-dependent metalloprotease